MEKMLRACLNWKVIGALALLGLGIWAVSPNLLAAALPVLLLAACLLSMLLMMRGMGHGEDKAAQSDATARSAGEQHTAVAREERRDAEVAQLREEINVLRAELRLRGQRDQQADEQR